MVSGFERFLDQREQAANAYVTGNGGPVDALVPHSGTATFHSPDGATITGATSVAKRYLADAQAFRPNGKTHFDILQRGADGELGFWTGYQVADVQIGDMPAPKSMRIRVTEIFRKLEGEWKLIHRHADFGAPPR